MMSSGCLFHYKGTTHIHNKEGTYPTPFLACFHLKSASALSQNMIDHILRFQKGHAMRVGPQGEYSIQSGTPRNSNYCQTYHLLAVIR